MLQLALSFIFFVLLLIFLLFGNLAVEHQPDFGDFEFSSDACFVGELTGQLGDLFVDTIQKVDAFNPF